MNLYEFQPGEDYSRKEKELYEALAQIETIYIEFFNSRASKFELEEHDRLHNHWAMTNFDLRVRFGVDISPDFPEHIRAECYQAYKRIFGTDKE